MLSADSTPLPAATQALYESDEDEAPRTSAWPTSLTWLGEKKRLIGAVTLAAALISLVYALLITPTYTARTTLLAPGSQQQSGSAAALAALGGLGGLSAAWLRSRPTSCTSHC